MDLLIRYNWNNELSPGQASPSKANLHTLHTVQEQISAREKVPFTYYPGSPLPQRADGLTSVVVVSYTL
ncbi:MAG: hypothetical protein ACREX9_01190 [Gammaproteobacteria bacterium]